MADKFPGMPKDFFAFFRELKKHNERAWFEDNKQRYRESVQAPMSEFVGAMAPHLRKISKNFVCDPRPNGGSIFRIHRDVRFSKDKRPYKENAGCYFRHAGGCDVHAPGFYVHFAPGELFFGGGSWMPDPKALARIREGVAARPAAWKKVLADKTFQRAFGGVRGEALSRPPRGFAPDHALIEDIKRKSFYALHDADAALALSPKLVGEVAKTFAVASPLVKFLCGALDVPF
ncbi:MAG TPA: DUF2461 domain-containing protein [Rhizomicrobium sp.]|nr:DUF2461 domain-containing protein [Rhizomicrobium sp.]